MGVKRVLQVLIPTALSVVLIGRAATIGPRWAKLAPVGMRPSPPDASDGRLRAFATFHPEAPRPIPPCLWKYRISRTSTVHFSGDNRVVLDDGRTLRLSARETVSFFEEEGPRVAATLPPESEAAAGAYFRAEFGEPRIVSRACLGPTERVWVEGCVQGDRLTGCPELDDRVVLTTGDRGRRAPWFSSRMTAVFAMALLGVTLLAGGVGGATGSHRRVIDDLAARAGVAPSTDLSRFAVGVLTLVSLIAAVASETTLGAYVLALTTAALVAVLIARWSRRLAQLRAAGAALRQAETSRLRDASRAGVELALRVCADAPTVPGFDRRPHAAVRFTLTEYYVKDPKKAQTLALRDGPQGVYPPQVPVEDASGRGALHTAHCALDARTEYAILSWTPERDAEVPWLAEVLAKHPRHPQHSSFGITWSPVDPGDPLLVFGAVTPGVASSPSPTDDYRASAHAPEVRGSPSQPLLVHVGDEGPLLRAIRVESAARRAGLALVALTVAASVAGLAVTR